MNTKKIISSVAIGAGAIILGLGLQYAMASWTPAPASPPNSNVAAPINVSSSAQAKAGGLSVGTTTLPSGYSFGVTGGASIDALLTQAFTLANGTQGAGKVLTSDANGVGTWQTATSSSSSMGWVDLDSGYVYWASGMYVWPSTNVDHSPEATCIRAGYSHAMGPGRATVSTWGTTTTQYGLATSRNNGDGKGTEFTMLNVTNFISGNGWIMQVLCVY